MTNVSAFSIFASLLAVFANFRSLLKRKKAVTAWKKRSSTASLSWKSQFHFFHTGAESVQIGSRPENWAISNLHCHPIEKNKNEPRSGVSLTEYFSIRWLAWLKTKIQKKKRRLTSASFCLFGLGSYLGWRRRLRRCIKLSNFPSEKPSNLFVFHQHIH